MQYYNYISKHLEIITTYLMSNWPQNSVNLFYRTSARHTIRIQITNIPYNCNYFSLTCGKLLCCVQSEYNAVWHAHDHSLTRTMEWLILQNKLGKLSCVWNLQDSKTNLQNSLNVYLEENLLPELGHLSH
jgi:hypothetical protein